MKKPKKKKPEAFINGVLVSGKKNIKKAVK